jgi:hypothetical protein
MKITHLLQFDSCNPRTRQFWCSLASGITLATLTSGNLALAHKPDALLSVDLNRAAVVEKIITAWSNEIPPTQFGALKSKLNALRADSLLAANLSGTFEGVLEVILSAEKVTKAEANAKQYTDSSKAIGDLNRDLVYTPLTPCRIADTRFNTQLVVGESRGFIAYSRSADQFLMQGGTGTSNCGVPAGARAIAANFTVVSPSTFGNISVRPTGTPIVASSLVNFGATDSGTAIANAAVVPLAEAGGQSDFTVYADMGPNGRLDLVIDVLGYFGAPIGGMTVTGLRVTNETSVSPNVLGGASSNSVLDGVRGASIGGGGVGSGLDPLYGSAGPNRITDHFGHVGGGASNRAGNNNSVIDDATFATVGGGRNNVAGGQYSFAGGGIDNSATGYISSLVGGEGNQASSNHTFVGGGTKNVADAVRSSVVGGGSNTANAEASGVLAGDNNTAAGPFSSVVGGKANTAAGQFSVVLGGTGNVAAGPNSLAAGVKARAGLPGCFVWGDSSSLEEIDCVLPDQFVVRARGGVQFITSGVARGNPGSPSSQDYAGALLPAGAGAWTTLSDINTKTAIANVSPRNVLEALIKMPVLTWQYKAQPGNVRHMGPSAQAFRKAFGLGDSPLGISTVDADGVALAAIQGLNQKLVADSKSKDAKIATLERELAAIKKKLGL